MLKLAALSAIALVAAAAFAAAGPVEDFHKADRNSDGILERAEFAAFIDLRAESGNATAKKVRTFGAYRIALSRVDADSDGQISGEELVRYDREHNP